MTGHHAVARYIGCAPPHPQPAVNPTPFGVQRAHNGEVHPELERLAGDRARLAGLGALGAASAIGTAWYAVGTGQPGLLVPVTIPTSFLLGGLLVGRARPDHPGALQMALVGALHLVSFALSVSIVSVGAVGLVPWLVALTAEAAFLGGFLSLVLLLACYPSGRLRTRWHRLLANGGLGLLLLALLNSVVARGAVPLPLEVGSSEVAAPHGLPLVESPVELGNLLPLLVVAGLAVLVGARRGLSEQETRALAWAKLAGVTLALLLVSTPAGSALFGEAVWSVVFAVPVALLPLVLLAGLVQFRLLAVESYVVRALGRGGVVSVLLSVFALVAAVADRTTGSAVAALVAGAAALGGAPLLRRVEAWADRRLTGGRVGRRETASALRTALVTVAPNELPSHALDVVQQGLDIAWVRCRWSGRTESSGVPVGEPHLTCELRAAGDVVGSLECGPRRGGWGAGERELLRGAADQIAAAVRAAALSEALDEKVTELTEARIRLVAAEDAARRRIERDLHDGVQQQLVALLAQIAVAEAAMQQRAGNPPGPALATAKEIARDALADLRELVAGLHPPLLVARGLAAAVAARVDSLPLEIELDIDPRISGVRFADELEGAAYFVVCEALTNVVKHSGAGRARVVVAPTETGGVRVAVTDQGGGGACDEGAGLSGLRDRVEALQGVLTVQTCAGVGTTVAAELPALPARVGIRASS